MASSKAPEPMKSKQWSCSTLLRGQSMVEMQKFQLDDSMSMTEKIAVSWLCTHVGKGPGFLIREML